MVNPLAWDKGLVLAQCSGCEAWHKLRDAGGLVQVGPHSSLQAVVEFIVVGQGPFCNLKHVAFAAAAACLG
jgi:DNL zinc finger